MDHHEHEGNHTNNQSVEATDSRTEHSVNKMALSATLHCLFGCAIGELIGVTIGTVFGFAPQETVILAGTLSFVSGYGVSTMPLMRAGASFIKALRLVLHNSVV